MDARKFLASFPSSVFFNNETGGNSSGTTDSNIILNDFIARKKTPQRGRTRKEKKEKLSKVVSIDIVNEQLLISLCPLTNLYHC